MMKRGLFLTHINQIIFWLDVGQRKMTNEKDNKIRNDKLEMRNGFQRTNEKGQMRNEEGGGNRGDLLI